MSATSQLEVYKIILPSKTTYGDLVQGKFYAEKSPQQTDFAKFKKLYKAFLEKLIKNNVWEYKDKKKGLTVFPVLPMNSGPLTTCARWSSVTPSIGPVSLILMMSSAYYNAQPSFRVTLALQLVTLAVSNLLTIPLAELPRHLQIQAVVVGFLFQLRTLFLIAKVQKLFGISNPIYIKKDKNKHKSHNIFKKTWEKNCDWKEIAIFAH